MTALSDRTCVPCRGGTPPLRPEQLAPLLEQLDSGWELERARGERPDGAGYRLKRTYEFKNFREALAFTNRVGAIAEAQGHHPNIALAWGKVTLTIWTHKIDGLTESDFILAAKCDVLLSP